VLVGVDFTVKLRREFEGAVGLAGLSCLEGRGGHALVVGEFSLVVAGELLPAALHV
jgi:hypothetical protein